MTSIVCSDLERAVQTAELLNRSLNLPLEMDAGLREQDWGQWSGRCIRDLRIYALDQVRQEEARGWEFCPPGGESRSVVLNRALRALRRVGERNLGKHVLVVTHKGVLKCLLYRLLGLRFLPDEGDPLQPCTVHTVFFEFEGAQPQKILQKEHGRPEHVVHVDGFGHMGLLALNQDVLGAPCI
jgi:broad specificity phosphatase PhoE